MFENPGTYQGQVDPETGYLCLVTYWYPGAEGALPGGKLSASGYLSADPTQLCLCGSGKSFQECCQRQRFWHPLCPNPGVPGEAGYSLVAPQKVTFHRGVGEAIRATLNADGRFQVASEDYLGLQAPSVVG